MSDTITPLNNEDIKTYGKTGFLDRIFKSKRGFITLPADISLENLDTHSEEE